jgi:hypothetical protein
MLIGKNMKPQIKVPADSIINLAALPIISLLIGIFFSTSIFESIVFGFVAWCWGNIIVVISETQSLKTTTQEEMRSLQITIQEEMRSCLHDQAITLNNIKDNGVLREMNDLIKFHNEMAKATGFSPKHNKVVKYFVEYQLKKYVQSLSEVRSSGKVFMPSDIRMKVAEDEILDAKKSVLAVSIDNDQWRYVTPYLKANIKAAERKAAEKKAFDMRRVFIVNKVEELTVLAENIQKQMKAGIKIKLASR